MRKCLLFAALLMVWQHDCLQAQILFEAPDTVCVRQPVQLTTNRPDAASHYWGFCSGYLLNNPTGAALPKDPYSLDGPSDIDIIKEGDNYYGFVITANTVNEFKRLEFGNDLSSTPTVTNFGNFDGALPLDLNSLHIVKDETNNNWHIFLSAGNDPTNSVMARIDFGNSFANVPNIVNFGNFGGLLDGPHGMFIGKEGDKWIGFVMNKSNNHIIRMDMGTNISITPQFTDIGPTGTINAPHDLIAVRDNGNWYFFVANEGDNSLTQFRLGPSLDITTPPPSYNIPDDDFFGPNGLSFIRDCDNIHLFVTQVTSHEIVRVDMDNIEGPYTIDPLGNVGNMGAPTGLSRMLRDKDNVYAFVSNYNDNSISRITYQQCTNSSIPFSTTKRPPAYSYDAPGRYNIYYEINGGSPDMQVECQQISVVEIPPIELSNDTTICQGDTISLRALSITALNITWSPAFNISQTDAIDIRVWPDYTVQYRVLLPYQNGCIVDTSVDVTVNKVRSDAGPDRVLTDGSSTLLGGPFTSSGVQYAYTWRPGQFLSNSIIPNPVASPDEDATYYLYVTDTAGCQAIDTVNITIGCNDINLPNAFAPNANSTSVNSLFGIMNNENLVQLNTFSIYDRWGQKVFTTTDRTKGWDGTVNGKEAPVGVYVWEADGFCRNGRRIQTSGNVTLLR